MAPIRKSTISAAFTRNSRYFYGSYSTNQQFRHLFGPCVAPEANFLQHVVCHQCATLPITLCIFVGSPWHEIRTCQQESLHIMFTALKEPLEEYMDQKVTLVFKKLGSKEIEFQVEKVSSKTMNSHKDH